MVQGGIMSYEIKEGDVVTVEYVGSLDNGMVFTSSKDDGPLTFKVGEYHLIKGLDNAVIGMAKGRSKKVKVEPREGFGEYDEKLIVTFPLAQLPENAAKGMQLKDESDDGKGRIWTIKEINSETSEATLDGNHRLAGHPLHFEIKIQDVL
jgi:FKBP-type peptidyl-prolyl cis-trans isomerase 2